MVMLLGDEWAGHRSVLTNRPLGDKTDWTEWDFMLDEAFQIIEAYTDQDGIHLWKLKDPEAAIDATYEVNMYHEARDKMQKTGKLPDGAMIRPKMQTFRENNEFWTYAEWREAERQRILEEASESGKLE